MSRPAVGQHPARIVLLDVSSPFDVMIGRSICDALENILGLGSSLAGLTRMPLLGIYVITAFPEMVLPLTNVKSNSTRLFKALQEMRTLLEESSQDRKNETENSLSHGLVEACRQFQRYIGNIQQSSSSFDQLEIIVLTARRGNIVQQNLKELPSQVDLGLLKRILSVTVRSSVSDLMEVSSPDEMVIDGSGEECSGLVDMITVDCDPVSLQRFFYQWLTETLSGQEHVHLLLPPPTPADSLLCIKCDLVEKMLNPTQLPFNARYDLSLDASIVKVVYPTPSKATGMTVPIHKLKTMKSLPRSGLCESVLFGLPLLVVPTSCWTIDWEELERNQAKFNALCDELSKKDHVLLLQMTTTSSTSTSLTNTNLSMTNANKTAVPVASGYFIMMPSENRTLLLKGVISAELLLPTGRPQCMKPTSTDDELCVQASLSQLPTSVTFNPLQYNSGLFDALKHSCLPKSVLAKGWGLKRSEPRKIITQHTYTESAVPSPPKMGKTPAKPGNRHTATMWSNPLNTVVKKANKSITSPKNNTRPLGNMNTNRTKMSWKSGFIED